MTMRCLSIAILCLTVAATVSGEGPPPAYRLSDRKFEIGPAGQTSSLSYNLATPLRPQYRLSRWQFSSIHRGVFVPPYPPGESIDKTVEQARQIRDWTIAAKYRWFYTTFRNGARLDLKQRGREFEEAGNHNFGVAAEAAGLTLEEAQRAAGIAQGMAGTATQLKDSAWLTRVFYVALLTAQGDAATLDDPRDQEQIAAGYNFLRDYANAPAEFAAFNWMPANEPQPLQFNLAPEHSQWLQEQAERARQMVELENERQRLERQLQEDIRRRQQEIDRQHEAERQRQEREDRARRERERRERELSRPGSLGEDRSHRRDFPRTSYDTPSNDDATPGSGYRIYIEIGWPDNWNE